MSGASFTSEEVAGSICATSEAMVKVVVGETIQTAARDRVRGFVLFDADEWIRD